ncbi:hypothetical protein EYF80_031671 [Liparis tanakae]|uniref:Uncharacterized protein n=1 Tax=Liparis tanakae TaxID=230148 RepID=A0A4Z2GX38_9TELE|nr:hypothetical protein EYF80_031671 [Liparis tanakae]
MTSRVAWWNTICGGFSKLGAQGEAPGFSRSLRYGTRLYSFRTNSQSRSGMVRLASVPRHSRTHSSSSSSARISAARSPT